MLWRGGILLIGFLLLWQVLVWGLAIPNYLVPTPWQVALTIWQAPTLLLQQTWPTVAETLLGLLVAVFWGVLMAIAMGLFRMVRFWMLPILLVSQAIPTFAIAPLFVVWFGYGMSSKVAVTIFALFFPVTIAFFDGLRRTDSGWLDLASVMHANRYRRLWYIQLPAALPALASGIRVATAWAPMAAVIGEWVGSSEGLGFLMLNANSRVDIPLMFAALLCLVIFSLLLYFVVDHLLKRWIYWVRET